MALTSTRPMTQSRTLRRLVRSGATGDQGEFRRAAEDLIHEERQKRHHLLANDLELLLDPAGSGKPRPPRPYDVPRDRERGLALVEVRSARRDLGDIVLSDANRAAIDEIILEHDRSELLASHGLSPTARLLLCGPPGCGKTTAAEVLACELGLDLAIVRFDAVVSSFLGETSANLRAVFDFLERERVLALFDEFDALGKTRADEDEHGELKRVVSALLQMIDAYRGRSVLVAASNHEQLLDLAIWRRFDEVLLLEPPSLPQLRDLLAAKLRSVRHDLPVDDTGFLKTLVGMSHADVERVVIRATKNMVLAGRELLTKELFDEARRREEKRLGLVRRR
jgi:SpoVK/Ycf46/Vps4 family AAA+-type ATPase